MPSTLKVQVIHENGTVIVRLIGEARLDVEEAAFQLDRVIVHHPKLIVVDATQLSFLSSLGMSLLVNLKRTATKSGGAIKLVGLQPRVSEAMSHARLLELFQLHPDMASAMGDAGLPTPSSSPAAAAPIPATSIPPAA